MKSARLSPLEVNLVFSWYFWILGGFLGLAFAMLELAPDLRRFLHPLGLHSAFAASSARLRVPVLCWVRAASGPFWENYPKHLFKAIFSLRGYFSF